MSVGGDYSRQFWAQLDQLRLQLRAAFNTDDTLQVSKQEVLSRIEDTIVDVVNQISSNSMPFLRIRSRRRWDNYVYIPNVGLQMIEAPTSTTVSLGHKSSVEKFGLLLKALSMTYKLVSCDRIATKRDLYYEEPHLFRSQVALDNILDEVACMLQVSRWSLNVVATSKGLIAGDLKFRGQDGELVDCSSGVALPSEIHKLQDFQTSATTRFVLVVEKDATFQRLLNDKFCERVPCILVTGKGVPDVNVRLMIKKIWVAFQLPVLGLMDADPYGIEIMFVYRFGSMSQSHDSRSLALPFMKWIGIFPSDISKLCLPADCLLPLTQKDASKCRDLLLRPYVQHFPAIEEEIRTILSLEVKAEIQALTRISPTYLSLVYIQSKIMRGEWI